MHAVDGGGEGATLEDRTGFVTHERRETAGGSAVGRERDRELDFLRLEQIQHRVWMGLGRSEHGLANNLSVLEVPPFGGICTLDALEELIADVGEAVLFSHAKE